MVKHLVGKGHDAVIVYPSKLGDEQTLSSLPSGCRAIECQMSPNGTSLFQDMGYLVRLVRVFGFERPDLVFNYTVKPNIYGGIAAKIKRIPSVAMAPGLGYTFARAGIVGALLRKFYVLGLNMANTVFVLNSSDQEILINAGLKREKIVLLRGGEGVDLIRYPFSAGEFLHPRFLMISRLLYEKGYSEFVEVAKRVRSHFPDVRFEIAGSLAEQSPSGVPRSVIEEDDRLGSINYLGHQKDIAKELSDPNTVVVLPSYYREGMNRSLMEACSSGRPIITTNLPGLREMVIDGENGYLVRPQDVGSLFEAIMSFIHLPEEKKRLMGQRSRMIAESQFGLEAVLEEYDHAIAKVLTSNV